MGTRSRICPIYIYIYIYIYIIYYIENCMFRRLVLAIFRLYMKHLVSSCTKHIYIYIYMGYLHGVGRGSSGHEISYLT